MHLFLIFLSFLTTSIYASAQVGQNALLTDPSSDYFARARQLYDAAQQETHPEQKSALFKRAIPILENYIRIYPNHKYTQAAYYYQAESYQALGWEQQANESYRYIIQHFRKGHYVAAAAYRLAFDQYNHHRYLPAARLFKLTANQAKDPKDQIRAVYYQAQCYLKLKDTKRALPLLKKIIQSPTDNPYKQRAEIASGHILLQNDQFAEALKFYQSLIAATLEQPELNIEIYYHAGIAASHLKKSKLAKEYFNIVLKNKTKSPWKSNAYIGLLQLYYQDKDYKTIIQQKPPSKLSKAQIAQQGLIIGQAYFQLKRYADAVNFFIDVERAAPNTDRAFEAAYYKLISLYNLETTNNIQTLVDQFVLNYAAGRGTSKYIHQALLIKAEHLYANQKYKEAAETYSSINTQYIDKRNLSSLLYKKAWSLTEVGNHSGAVDTFNQFIKISPKSDLIDIAYAKRGQSHVQLNNRIQALKDFDRVIKNNPKSDIAAMALQQSARIQRNAKKYPDVIVRLKQLLSDFPDLSKTVKANSHYWLGNAYFKTDQYKNAIPQLRLAKEIEPEAYNKQASMLIVLSFYSLKDVDGLKGALKNAEQVGLQPQIPLPIYRWIGNQCYNAGEFRTASNYLTKGCEQGVPQKTPIIIWRLLGKALLLSDQYNRAIQAFDNVLEIEKDPARRVEAMLEKCRALIQLKRYEEALTIGKEALAQRPSGPLKAGLLMAIGDIAYLTEDYPTAAEHYVVVAETFEEDKSHPRALHQLAKALEKVGKPQEATQYRTQLKTQYPNFQSK